jgi:hypothetical protein
VKVRFRVRCERCKVYIEFGEAAVRIYGRLWHLDCALAYRRARQDRYVAA